MKKKLCAALLLAVLLCLFAPIAQAVECAPGQHKYTETGRTPATAMEDGEIDYVCTLCGNEYTRTIYATDHLWGNWIIDQAPTCTEPGRRHRTCTRGQNHDETAIIPALRHDYKETSKEPTCLEPGKIVFICTRDSAHTYEETLPAPGSHSFGEWHTETPAGEGTEGLEIRGCARCGFEETNILEALPIHTTMPPTVPTAEPPMEPSTEPPRTIPVMDIVLVGANTVALGWFAFLLITYFLGLAFARRRRKAILLRDELRKEVHEQYGYK